MKYSRENVVAVKRDLQRYQKELSQVLDAIKIAKQELVAIETQKQSAVAEQARENSKSVIASIEESVLSFFKKKKTEIRSMSTQEETLKKTIQKLQFHRAVLAAEINQAPLPDNRLPQLDSAIKNMRKNLSRVMSQADATEEELTQMKKAKDEFSEAILILKADQEKLTQSAKLKQAELDRIDAEREAVLAELVKDKALEAQLKERNQDMATMSYRLSEEYKEVFSRIPSRTNKV